MERNSVNVYFVIGLVVEGHGSQFNQNYVKTVKM